MLALGELETRSPQRKKNLFWIREETLKLEKFRWVKYSVPLEGAKGGVGRGAYLISLTIANTVQ